MKKKLLSIMTLFVLLGSLSACVPKPLNIVVSNYPLEFLFERIAGDTVNVTNISEGGIVQTSQISKDYEKIFKEANVMFYINELDPYFPLYLKDFDESKIKKIDLSERSSLYPFKRFTTVVSGDQEALIESEYYDGEEFKSVDKYEQDPILWMDPIAMTSMARTIKDYLVKERPDHAKLYKSNFEALEVELTRLQADFQKLRDEDYGIAFATMTPSFGNWQRSFNVGVYPITLSKYGVLPSDEQLEIIRNRIMMDDVKYIAYEDNLPDDYIKLFNQLKTELELKQINLSNLFKLTEEDKKDKYDYIDKMYQNLETLEAMTKEQ
ncbi:metal ABC transporter solute-binding protein, Zn/Mn family [Erysipelothrix urinaevulpis]|uniref:metal ABC transporter substrate-binding protein n=1 Tax=Erysipelothrix urinaevulpis TaxID=2683717 RepID=UPI00135CA98C|nr:zinc ABC transporter substrate-binding protein [Erysipelothrix urinaevulpis]